MNQFNPSISIEVWSFYTKTNTSFDESMSTKLNYKHLRHTSKGKNQK